MHFTDKLQMNAALMILSLWFSVFTGGNSACWMHYFPSSWAEWRLCVQAGDTVRTCKIKILFKRNVNLRYTPWLLTDLFLLSSLLCVQFSFYSCFLIFVQSNEWISDRRYLLLLVCSLKVIHYFPSIFQIFIKHTEVGGFTVTKLKRLKGCAFFWDTL